MDIKVEGWLVFLVVLSDGVLVELHLQGVSLQEEVLANEVILVLLGLFNEDLFETDRVVVGMQVFDHHLLVHTNQTNRTCARSFP